MQHIFERQASIGNFVIDSIVPANPVYNYRNKMEFTFSPHRWVLEDEPEEVDKSFAIDGFLRMSQQTLNQTLR